MHYLRSVACSYTAFLLVLTFLSTTGCDLARDTSVLDESEQFPGGDGSVSTVPFPSLMRPPANFPIEDKPYFYAGKALAGQPWIKAPTTTTTRDGLGPIYNARSCLACHAKGGPGKLPELPNEPLFSGVVRVSIPGNGGQTTLGVIAEPTYGDQLQTQSVALFHQLGLSTHIDNVNNEAKPEAKVYIDWQTSLFRYPDGYEVNLRQPRLRIADLGYGPLNKEVLQSLRKAPAIHGMGLLALIRQTDISVLADPDDADKDGISGRVNTVWNHQLLKWVPGRFGLKANFADLNDVVANAFASDIGISNPVFNHQPCSTAQLNCLTMPDGTDEHGSELSQHLLELVVNFTRNLAVPKSRMMTDDGKKGRQLFHQLNCNGCHQPNFTTATSDQFSHLGQQKIWPYSDFLLHDMGPELADHRPDFTASGTEWRTPPLWSIGLYKELTGSLYLLHDGRARSVEESILWHGGEADKAKRAFTKLNIIDRNALVNFVNTL